MKVLIIILLALACLGGEDCFADPRTDAIALQTRFRDQGISSKRPEELKSMDATITAAEAYFQNNDLETANRYYLLAIQKGRLVELSLVQAETLPASGSPTADQQAIPSAPPAEPSKPTLTAQPAAKPLHVDPDLFVEIQSDKLTGSVGNYIIEKNDSLRLVAAKLGMSRTQLAAMNGLDSKANLVPGQTLRYNNRRIVAKKVKNGIIINIPDRTLHYFENGKLVTSVPVALGTPNKTEEFVWHTPTGRFRIIDKQKDPTWTVPPSIQEEMRLEGKEVIESVPPGPENPLGKYAMKTSLPGILIHSTLKPWSIYTFASHGCIRVYPDKMEHLFRQIKLNTRGEIIYQPVKLETTENGRILLEAHADVYTKTKGIEAEARRLINSMKLADRVDWKKVKKVTSKKAGVAIDVTLDPAEPEQPVNKDQLASPS
jgi:L,D-transpeptidase ErfK/SrfK